MDEAPPAPAAGEAAGAEAAGGGGAAGASDEAAPAGEAGAPRPGYKPLPGAAGWARRFRGVEELACDLRSNSGLAELKGLRRLTSLSVWLPEGLPCQRTLRWQNCAT